MARKTLLLTAASVLAFAASVGVAQAGGDACATVAAAKFAQWGQKRVMIMEQRTFADGSVRGNELIFTHNTVYGQLDHRPWNSLPILQSQRSAGSPDHAAKTMGLADCHVDGTVNEGGQTASVYSYTYLPDAQGNRASGKIWIAADTGLPVRQELTEAAKPANAQVAAAITTHYSYGDAAVIPAAAERADLERRAVASVFLWNLQTGHPAAAN